MYRSQRYRKNFTDRGIAQRYARVRTNEAHAFFFFFSKRCKKTKLGVTAKEELLSTSEERVKITHFSLRETYKCFSLAFFPFTSKKNVRKSTILKLAGALEIILTHTLFVTSLSQLKIVDIRGRRHRFSDIILLLLLLQMLMQEDLCKTCRLFVQY